MSVEVPWFSLHGSPTWMHAKVNIMNAGLITNQTSSHLRGMILHHAGMRLETFEKSQGHGRRNGQSAQTGISSSAGSGCHHARTPQSRADFNAPPHSFSSMLCLTLSYIARRLFRLHSMLVVLTRGQAGFVDCRTLITVISLRLLHKHR